MKTTSVILLIIFLVVFLHIVMNWDIPLQSDVNWYFRLQISNKKELAFRVPEGYREIGAYPTSLLQSLITWHRFTGRYNLLDTTTLRISAIIAQDNPNTWRMIFAAPLCASLVLFYWVARKLQINSVVALILTLGLLVSPIDAWTSYHTSEPKAIFFLMLSIYFTLRPISWWSATLSSIFMVLAFLMKETFIVGWTLIPFFYCLKQSFRKKIIYLIPHLAGILLIGLFVILLNTSQINKTSDYIFANKTQGISPRNIFDTVTSFTPKLFQGKLVALSLFSAMFFLFIKKGAVVNIFKQLLAKRLIIASLVAAISASILPYIFTNRVVGGHYILPGNFFSALLCGILITAFCNFFASKLKKYWTTFILLLALFFLLPFESKEDSLVNGLILIATWVFSMSFLKFNLLKFHKKGPALVVLISLFLLFYPHARFVYFFSIQNRVDQMAWEKFNQDVYRLIPVNALVNLIFEDPYMIETAQSLEVNTWLTGRDDLSFYMSTNPLLYKSDAGFTKYLVDTFNRRTYKQISNTINIYANRDSGCKNTYSRKLQQKASGMINIARALGYRGDFCPYLNYYW